MASQSRSNSGVGIIGVLFLILFLVASGTMVMMTMTPSLAARQIRETSVRAQKIRNAINAYIVNHGITVPAARPADNMNGLYADDGSGACAMVTAVGPTFKTLQGWCGPYLFEYTGGTNEIRQDGWGTAFQFSNATGILTSCGPDRTCANADDITYGP